MQQNPAAGVLLGLCVGDALGVPVEFNGNGSLMRILPLIFAIRNQPVQERFLMVSDVSVITHSHIRSVFACFLYCE